MTTKTKAIRALNDELRQNFATGTALMTAGVAALGAETVARIVKTIGVYDDFWHASDPYEEHDFGSFEVDGYTIFFKDRLFRFHADRAFPRSVRPSRHQARDHDHAGGGVLTDGPQLTAQCESKRRLTLNLANALGQRKG
jgi:hypothetical protein